MAACKTCGFSNIGEMTKDYLKNTFFKSQEFHDMVFENAKYILEGRFEVKSEPKFMYIMTHFANTGRSKEYFYSIYSSMDKAINDLRKKYDYLANNLNIAYNFSIDRMELEFDTICVSWIKNGVEGNYMDRYYIKKVRVDKLNKED